MSEKLLESEKILNRKQIVAAVGCLVFAVIVYAGGPMIFTPFYPNLPLEVRNFFCNQQAFQPSCTPSKFSKIDGSCTNPEHPKWGTPNQPYARLLHAHYSDDYSAFAKSVTGNDLPNPRVLSKTLFGEKSFPDPEYTIIMMQFGQLMAHDMSFTALKQVPSCCTYGGQWASNHPTCPDIHVPASDEFYSAYNVTCMNFTATITDHDLECAGVEHTPAQPLSAVTSFLDLSVIYGNSDKQAKALRTLEGGKLATEEFNGEEFPPHDPNATINCAVESDSDTCFIGGDERINQSPHLTIVHVLFIREHNRIADELQTINPQWDDERLFQEARRISIAQYQYISYYEWLSIFLGTQNMIDLGMLYFFEGDEYVNDFNASVSTAVFNEFAQAAFRFFHTQIEGTLELQNEDREASDTILMGDHFDNPNVTVQYFHELARSLMTQMSQLTDDHFDRQTREFLFKHMREYGDDLRSIDIQRSRGHGVASYNDFRRLCELPVATQWDDYLDLIPSEHVERMRSVYEDFRDVELTVGAFLENQIDNTTLAGPTVLCILNKQFLNTRIGDRFWFETGADDVAFTRPQLAEIRKSSFARIFCDNSHSVTTVQPLAFRTINIISNPLKPCSEIPIVDLTKWAE